MAGKKRGDFKVDKGMSIKKAQISPHKLSLREDTWWWMGWVWQGRKQSWTRGGLSKEHQILIATVQ